MKYIEAPAEYKGYDLGLFIAGGITGCPDWQGELVSILKNEDIAILNPRRKHFPMEDPAAGEGQIQWEFEHLKRADAVSFWFPKESVCPIALLELGKSLKSGKPLFIGVHPEYERKADVEIQTRLEKPGLRIAFSLESLAGQIKEWAALYGDV